MAKDKAVWAYMILKARGQIMFYYLDTLNYLDTWITLGRFTCIQCDA